MRSIAVETFLAAPPEVVWADLARLESHLEWMGDAERIEFLSVDRAGVGTRTLVMTRVGPFRTRDEMHFTAWDPPRMMAVDHRGLFTGSGRFLLDPSPGGTRFRWQEDIRFPWYLGGFLGAAVARPILAAIWRRNLRRLASRFG